MRHEVELRRRRDGQVEGVRVEVRDGATLIAAAHRAGLPVANACGGHSLCARCGLQVIEGAEHLSEEGSHERRAKAANRIPEGQRLACQARISGPVVATASYW